MRAYLLTALNAQHGDTVCKEIDTHSEQRSTSQALPKKRNETRGREKEEERKRI